MLANKYNTLTLTIVEMAQNAIDAGATRIFVGIDLHHRQMIVLDNGKGVSKEMFDDALASVAETKKGKRQIGRFGIGLISPLNKCNKFYFISQHVTSSHPVKWTFEAKQVERQKEEVRIPCENLSSMPSIPNALAAEAEYFEQSRWRTMVHLMDLSTDRTVTRIDVDAIEEQIRTKLGHHMHQKSIEMRLVVVDDGLAVVRDIKPFAFTGEPFDVITLEESDVGAVEFELYRARKVGGKRNGHVSVSEMDSVYPVAWREFINQARGGNWTSYSDVFEVLGSGYFEGIIRAKGITLMPERTKFEYNDALIGLYAVLDQWFAEYGKAYFEEEKDQVKDERYRQISLSVMESMRNMLRLPQFQELALGIQSHLHTGHIGEGHGKKGKNIIREDDKPSTRVGQGGAGRKRQRNSSTDADGQRNPDGSTRDGDIPFGVVGKGKRRSCVQDDSLGLWIEVTDFEYSTRLWEFDHEHGVLSFNSSNVIWADLDGDYSRRRTTKNDRMLEHLQKWIILKVLILLMLPVEEFEAARELVDAETKAYVHAFIKA
jgi:hypothetical protein